jgi:hypothetical protein
MILDTVSVVVEYKKVTPDKGEPYYNATFLPEHMCYGTGAASDAQRAQETAERLNGMYKTSERYYGAVRMDYEDAKQERLL